MECCGWNKSLAEKCENIRFNKKKFKKINAILIRFSK